mmetsp:Transcript_26152/g.29096  ORF Transcript_26152/g.29096 Transcript_26152/m.29096 type:complete len:274 (-) Transcript_26152:246-1067(-)
MDGDYRPPLHNSVPANEPPLKEEETGTIKKAPGKHSRGVPRRRGKVNIQFIQNKSKRHTTFSKRKSGLMKKVYELTTLTGSQALLLICSEGGHVYTFATPKLQPLVTTTEGKTLIQNCLNEPDPAPAHNHNPPAQPPAAPQQLLQQHNAMAYGHNHAHVASHLPPPGGMATRGGGLPSQQLPGTEGSLGGHANIGHQVHGAPHPNQPGIPHGFHPPGMMPGPTFSSPPGYGAPHGHLGHLPAPPTGMLKPPGFPGSLGLPGDGYNAPHGGAKT